ncbi:MAG: excinuclease ABC subunit UvrA [Bacteroidota bacterium]|nr:excinuclease ABC subunit UvrA [Bacteroidota bacterium]MDP4234475.1 excinuclease ABC subunit UvrA [Bacteroidota bacterium]MDP4244198.1 excinuclease ABC subunit UvrA [Bacteroidota bacterium]MDP4288818.1 excinuclease ABC subunit UvrA [Bacteroidota bacterium]
MIVVRGARVHNLKGVDVDIPREKLVVITGISGSGKSSLAFDTIYAEGQRRYVESLSAYARQFLDMMDRPDVDYIDGLSPAISIEQKTIGSTPRSTVGTVTEIYDFIRLLFARAGTQFCVDCNLPVEKQTIDQIIDALLRQPSGTHITILAPLVRGRKGHYRELFRDTLRQGYTRVRVDGKIQEITDGLEVDRYKLHTIEAVVDRLVLADGIRQRLTDSATTALKMGKGVMTAVIERDKTTSEDMLFSEKYSCPNCGRSYEEPQPNTFSFNSAVSACPRCHGLGEIRDFVLDLIIPDKTKSADDGAIIPFGKPKSNWLWAQVESVYASFGEQVSTAIEKLSPELLDTLMNGSGKTKMTVNWVSGTGRKSLYKTKWAGILETLKYWYGESNSEAQRSWAEEFMAASPCTECNGGRLKSEHLAIRIHGKNVKDVVTQSLVEAVGYFRSLKFEGTKQTIAEPILREIVPRLEFLLQVGLSYLSLDRSARSLSGGESQRIRLATQIGTQLVGVLYILDEPSIGLHQRDNRRLIHSLEQLRDLGNTVIVVEHDREMMESADLLIDIGPRAGEHGGHLVAYGPPEYFRGWSAKSNGTDGAHGTHETHPSQGYFVSGDSPTARYLSGEEQLEIPAERLKPRENATIVLEGATGNNLQSVDLRIPIGTFTCITGVSGSGKSTLINETLAPILNRHFYNSHTVPMPFTKVDGLDLVDKVIEIDQSPIGRTPRSNPATYTGLFTHIRDFFATLPEAKIRGYKVGRFSFNVKSGRCEECEGDGVKKIEMSFLPDVYVTCDVCKGKRYNRETLEVHYKGKSIADVLAMSVTEAEQFFSEIPRIKRKLGGLSGVGLGYIRLGQPAPTLSGGEAQRVKLATELSKLATGKTVYILDEPTTGLHFEDIRHLMHVLLALRARGNTVIVIEHNLDVIKMADWVIDLGPEGGSGGGLIVDEGTPEDVASRFSTSGSHTAFYLRKELGMPID